MNNELMIGEKAEGYCSYSCNDTDENFDTMGIRFF